MKKTIMALILATFTLMSSAFAATLEKDLTVDEQLVPKATEVKQVYVMNRLTGVVEEIEIAQESDYLPLIVEFEQGDLVATCDEQVKFNLTAQTKSYSQRATTRKLMLVPMTFKMLTKGEQQKYKEMKDFAIYAVEEQPVDANTNKIVVGGADEIETTHYIASMLTQIKSIRHM